MLTRSRFIRYPELLRVETQVILPSSDIVGKFLGFTSLKVVFITAAAIPRIVDCSYGGELCEVPSAHGHTVPSMPTMDPVTLYFRFCLLNEQCDIVRDLLCPVSCNSTYITAAGQTVNLHRGRVPPWGVMEQCSR